MKKNFKKIISKAKYLMLLPLTYSQNLLAEGITGMNIGSDTNLVKDIVEQPFVSGVIQSALFLGVILAVWNIAKDLLSGDGDGKSIWKNIGAILALFVLYYFLFMRAA